MDRFDYIYAPHNLLVHVRWPDFILRRANTVGSLQRRPTTRLCSVSYKTDMINVQSLSIGKAKSWATCHAGRTG